MRREILLPATREEVWAALTRPEQLSTWFEAEVDIDPRPRGAVTARHPDGTLSKGTVVAANSPYRLVMVWESGLDASGRDIAPRRLEFTLEAVAEGTRLTVIEAPMTTSPATERFFLEAVR